MNRISPFVKIPTTVAIIFFSLLNHASAEHSIEDLCSDVVMAIATADPVAYAHCFTTLHHRKNHIKKMFPNISDTDLTRVHKKFRRRNNAIHHSFQIIRDHINDPDASITLVSAESSEQETHTIKGHTYTGVSTLKCKFKVNEEEWMITLDDGLFLDNRWFLSDDPVSLETPDKVVKLRMFRGEYGHTTDKK